MEEGRQKAGNPNIMRKFEPITGLQMLLLFGCGRTQIVANLARIFNYNFIKLNPYSLLVKGSKGSPRELAKKAREIIEGATLNEKR